MIVHYYGHHHRGSGLGSIFARIFGKVASKVAAKTAIRSVAKVAGKTLKTVAKKALPVVKEAGISLAKEAAQYGAQQAAEAVQHAGEKAKKHGVPLSIINKVTAVANKGIETGKGELHKKLLKVAGAKTPKTPKRKRSRPSGTTTRTAAPRKKSRTSSSLSDTTNISSPSFINSQQPQPFQTVQAPPQTQTQSSSFQVPKTTGLSNPQRKNFGKKRSTKPKKTVVSTALKRRRSSNKSRSPASSKAATRPSITQALIDSL